jgi:hypothetical protein
VVENKKRDPVWDHADKNIGFWLCLKILLQSLAA